jgi:hypothetical protein
LPLASPQRLAGQPLPIDRAFFVIVEVEEFTVGQLVWAKLTLGPIVEFATHATDTIVKAFADVGLEQG